METDADALERLVSGCDATLSRLDGAAAGKEHPLVREIEEARTRALDELEALGPQTWHADAE